jgi:hypothetical protein
MVKYLTSDGMLRLDVAYLSLTPGLEGTGKALEFGGNTLKITECSDWFIPRSFNCVMKTRQQKLSKWKRCLLRIPSLRPSTKGQ